MKLRSEAAGDVGQASRLSPTSSQQEQSREGREGGEGVGSRTVYTICGWQLRRLKSEIRSPKPERSPKSEARNPNHPAVANRD
jgi:hypothetical protein